MASVGFNSGAPVLMRGLSKRQNQILHNGANWENNRKYSYTGARDVLTGHCQNPAPLSPRVESTSGQTAILNSKFKVSSNLNYPSVLLRKQFSNKHGYLLIIFVKPKYNFILS